MTTSDTLRQISKKARLKGMTQQKFLEGLYKFYLIHEVDLKLTDGRFDFNDDINIIREI